MIKTIRMETKDEQLFSKEVPLLTAASELCYHTVYCSVLNAEELRRENGIEVLISSNYESFRFFFNPIFFLIVLLFKALLEAYTRCVSIMGVDSKPTEVHYQIISNITKCFEVACNFENCKTKIIELPQLITDVCRVVYFKVSHIISVEILFDKKKLSVHIQSNTNNIDFR